MLGRPAEQVERRVEAARLQDLGEVLRLRLDDRVHLDADARQHADDGPADVAVVDVAVGRAVHADLEARPDSRPRRAASWRPPGSAFGRVKSLRRA